MTTTRNAHAKIEAREPFTTGGALRGGALDTRYPHTGRLPQPYRKIYLDLAGKAYYASKTLYVVYSYDTPIAWFDPFTETWVHPDVKYSTTTSHHRGQCPVTGTKGKEN